MLVAGYRNLWPNWWWYWGRRYYCHNKGSFQSRLCFSSGHAWTEELDIWRKLSNKELFFELQGEVMPESLCMRSNCPLCTDCSKFFFGKDWWQRRTPSIWPSHKEFISLEKDLWCWDLGQVQYNAGWDKLSHQLLHNTSLWTVRWWWTGSLMLQFMSQLEELHTISCN